jgi:uncharacterized membrane protein YfcA
VKKLAPGIVAGGLLSGAGLFALIKGEALGLLFAGFVGFSATQMLLDRKPKPGRQIPGPVGATAAGSAMGLVAGLVGAGGAFMSVPFMVWCNVAIHNAVATSAALGFPIALSSVAGYVIAGWALPSPLPGTLGYLSLPALAVLALASVLMAPHGARAAHRLDTKRLKKVFAVLLYGLAGFMLWKMLAP